MLQPVIAPVGPVPNSNIDPGLALRFVIVWTPSEKEKASGVTVVPNGRLIPRGLASVTVPVTRSLVV